MMEVAAISEAKHKSVLEVIETVLDYSEDIERIVIVAVAKDTSVEHYHNYMSYAETLGILDIGKAQILAKMRPA